MTETLPGRAYAFATCPPNEIVNSMHPTAMPATLHPGDWDTWLDGDA